MQITHEEARRFVQIHSDGDLEAPQKRILDSHLEVCAECRKYANSLQQMESILRPMLQRQWTRQPIPFSMGALTSNGASKKQDGVLLATRLAAFSAMFILFMFSAWQFTISRPHASGPTLANVPLIPVPSTSTQLTSTQTEDRTCGEMIYRAKENDTLESIAAMFSTSKAELLTLNHLKTESIQMGTELLIPLCNSTPTETINTLTTSFTPTLRTITSTPGG